MSCRMQPSPNRIKKIAIGVGVGGGILLLVLVTVGVVHAVRRREAGPCGAFLIARHTGHAGGATVVPFVLFRTCPWPRAHGACCVGAPSLCPWSIRSLAAFLTGAGCVWLPLE